MKDLQWTDPRLLKKYSLFKEYRKSLTIPFFDRSDMIETAEDSEEVLYAENAPLFMKSTSIQTNTRHLSF